ncbi:MrcB family domain-containing protein [Kribbella pratensis]|nr:DUF3578 domain-containing protein [Kribbella pratensis]
MEQVLAVAPEFSTAASPSMALRDQHLVSIARRFGELLAGLGDELLGDEIRLDVEVGGRRGSYSPTAWVRIYSKAHSPSATEGFYLVYLFASDGSRAYLSLNQGTSEWRSGKFRPLNDESELRSRASEARGALRDLDWAGLVPDGLLSIDLAVDSLQLGPESKHRSRNYEFANVIAKRYDRWAVPADEVLVQDLSDMLPLLAMLYQAPQALARAVQAGEGEPPAGRDGGGVAARTKARIQGRLLDSAARRAMEVYAEDAAYELLKDEWTVERVGRFNRGYDLECTNDDQVLHVEVKGTQGTGEEVILTRGEVRHHQAHGGHCEDAHALFVLAEITLVREPALRCEGGVPTMLYDWCPDLAALTPTEFRYRVPHD